MSTASLNLPDALPYPIKITSLLVQPGETVTRGTPLCDYSFVYTHPVQVSLSLPADPAGAKKPEKKKETRYGRWESPIDGVFENWLVHKGDTILSVQQARTDPVASLLYASLLVVLLIKFWILRLVLFLQRGLPTQHSDPRNVRYMWKGHDCVSSSVFTCTYISPRSFLIY